MCAMQDVKFKEFLSNLIISDAQLQALYAGFYTEVQRGLAKATHAQSDIKCYVTYVQELPTGDEMGRYLALDLGGTNFRVLLVTLKGHHEADIISEIYAIPKDIMVGTGTQLFDHIAKCLATFVHAQQLEQAHLPLGFTFSFPCVQLGLTKAVLTRWTKGFSCSGVEQHDVGALLQAAIQRRGDVAIDVMAILNDTTGTLMSCAHRNAECRIGVIIGTGCNACYVEQVQNAELLEEQHKLKSKNIIINTEWGAFGDSGALEFIRTEYDRNVDENSPNAGTQLFEKMISGMYLGEIVRLVLLKAIQQNLLLTTCKNKLELLERLSSKYDSFETRHISEIEADSDKEYGNCRRLLKQLLNVQHAALEDCDKLKLICECVSKRSAALVAVGLSALVNKMNQQKVIIGVDGSVYRFHPKFDAYIRKVMMNLVKPNLKFDLMLSEDGSGRGATLVAAVASQNS